MTCTNTLQYVQCMWLKARDVKNDRKKERSGVYMMKTYKRGPFLNTQQTKTLRKKKMTQ